MSFLNKLWDETVAGPTPDTGLGKLRKYNSFSAARSSSNPLHKSSSLDDNIPISRSITVIPSNSTSSTDPRTAGSHSVPSSPAGSNTPTSPFSPRTPRVDFKGLSKKKLMKSESSSESTGPKSPTRYDWIVLSGLDR